MGQSYDEENKVRQIVELKNASAEGRRDLEDKFQKYYEMFNATLLRGSDLSRRNSGFTGTSSRQSKYPYRSKLYMKETYKAIDTIHPIFMDLIFAQKNPFRLKGNKPEIPVKKVSAYERLMSIYLEKMDAYNIFDDIITEELVIGTAFAKMYWEKEILTKMVEESVEEPVTRSMLGVNVPTGEVKRKKVTRQKITIKKDSPAIAHISYKDIFFSSRATSLKDTWIIHRTWKTLEDLKSVNKKVKDATGEPLYKNLKMVEDALASGSSRAGDQEEAITRDEKTFLGLNIVNNIATVKKPDETLKMSLNDLGEIEIMEYWSQDGSILRTVAGGMYLIRETENPFEHGEKPFIYTNFKRRPKEIWGIGICELAEDGQDLLNTAVNQAMDSNALANNLMLIAGRNAGIEMEQVKARPGGVVFVDLEEGESVTSKVQQLKFAKVSVLDEIALGKSEIQEVTGAGKIAQGTYESGAVRNTSQTRLLQAGSGRRFMGKIMTYDNMFVKKFSELMYSMIGQFMTKEMVVDIIGSNGLEFVELTPEELTVDLEFISIGTKQMIEAEQLVQQLNNFLAIVSRVPQAEAIVKFRVLIKQIAKNLLGEDIADEVLRSDEEVIKLMQAMAAQQQQAGQAGGNTKPNTGGVNPSQPNPGGGAR